MLYLCLSISFLVSFPIRWVWELNFTSKNIDTIFWLSNTWWDVLDPCLCSACVRREHERYLKVSVLHRCLFKWIILRKRFLPCCYQLHCMFHYSGDLSHLGTYYDCNLMVLFCGEPSDQRALIITTHYSAIWHKITWISDMCHVLMHMRSLTIKIKACLLNINSF